MRSTRSLTGLAIVSCLALALAATPALAKKKHKKPKKLGPVVTVTTTGNAVPGTGISTANAICPAGLQAVGGGFKVSFEPGHAMVAIDSYRSASNTWTVDGVNNNGTNSAIADAYCRKNTFPVSEVTGTDTTMAGSGAIADAAATCPGNTRLVSGGFQSTHGPGAGDFAYFTTSFTSTSNQWHIAGTLNGSSAETVTAHAYCMSGIKAPTILSSTANSTVPGDGTASSTSPSCPSPPKPKKKGKKKRKKTPPQLLSAGGFLTPLPQISHPFGLVLEGGVVGSGWLTTARNLGPTGALTLISQGICV